MPRPPKSTVLFIVGSTASGKTEAGIAVALALRDVGHDAEIVNADSRQVYRRMSIGTAKPTPEQLAAVAHHLIDVVDPADGFSLAVFLKLARASIADIVGRGCIPIVVGGTGQYVWGLVEGWQAPAVPRQPEVRAALEAEAAKNGAGPLFARLAELDPAAAGFVDAKNTRRVIRALEVIETTGRPFSHQRLRSTPPFASRLFGLAVPRSELYARIDRRVDAMIEAGLVDEVRALLDKGCAPELPAFSSVGSREIATYIRGDTTLEEAERRIRTATHRLARAQASWFRPADSRIHWCDSKGQLVAEALSTVGA